MPNGSGENWLRPPSKCLCYNQHSADMGHELDFSTGAYMWPVSGNDFVIGSPDHGRSQRAIPPGRVGVEAVTEVAHA